MKTTKRKSSTGRNSTDRNSTASSSAERKSTRRTQSKRSARKKTNPHQRGSRRSKVRNQFSQIRNTPFRDNLYNYSDVLAVCIIILLAFLFIFWRVHVLMDYTTTAPTSTTTTETSVDAVDTSQEDLAQMLEADALEASKTGETVRFTIRSGSMLSTIADDLLVEGLISSKEDFVAAVEDSGASGSLKVGTYDIPVGASINQIIDILTK